MTIDELKTKLGEILAEEERPCPDWQHVMALCLALRESSLGDSAPHELHHFLADADIRQRDVEYASMQREELRNWLYDK